jgi:hypothetical protein
MQSASKPGIDLLHIRLKLLAGRSFTAIRLANRAKMMKHQDNKQNM